VAVITRRRCASRALARNCHGGRGRPWQFPPAEAARARAAIRALWRSVRRPPRAPPLARRPAGHAAARPRQAP